MFLCVLDTRAVDAEGCGDAWDCGGFHCSVLISEEEEGKGDAEEAHNNNNIQRETRAILITPPHNAANHLSTSRYGLGSSDIPFKR